MLLFSFSFLVLHDYAIASIDADTQSEICLLSTNKAALDTPSQIHDTIHSFLMAPKNSEPLKPVISMQNRSENSDDTLLSRADSIAPRPPIL